MNTRFKGYMGKILDVNLSTKKHHYYEISDIDREKFLGGKCLAAKILWDNLRPQIDPLSEENILVFTTSPMTGTGAPQSSRFNCSTKSPLTGGITSSNCGGNFGMRLKKAGYDGLIIRGKSDRPIWLEINEDKISFNDASDIWNKNTEEVQDRFDRQTGVLTIGPAGENQVLYACIMSRDRALGRGGGGAVMGSKYLKLITAKGNKTISIFDKQKFKKNILKWGKQLKTHSITGNQLPKYGTAGLMNICNRTNTLATKNFQYGNYSDAQKVSGEELAENHLVRNYGCASCLIKCSREVIYNEKKIKGPEYETMGMFGPMIQNNNIKKIIKWNYLCDLYGLDTISTGSTIACAMELSEKGLLKDFPCSFKSSDNISQMIEDIAYKKGAGAQLAKGSKRLANDLGDPQAAMQTKGLEFAIYEPRSSVGHGLGYATSNRGGCHLNGGYLVFLEALGNVTMDPFTEKAKAELTAIHQNLMEAISASGNCIFSTYAIVPDVPPFLYNKKGITGKLVSEILKLSRIPLGLFKYLRSFMLPFHYSRIPQTKVINSITGMKMHLGKFLEIGERGFTLERMFNLREGLDKKDDTLPERLTNIPQQVENPKSKVPLKSMLRRYYQIRDWDQEGRPNKSLLKKLNLI